MFLPTFDTGVMAPVSIGVHNYKKLYSVFQSPYRSSRKKDAGKFGKVNITPYYVFKYKGTVDVCIGLRLMGIEFDSSGLRSRGLFAPFLSIAPNPFD